MLQSDQKERDVNLDIATEYRGGFYCSKTVYKA